MELRGEVGRRNFCDRRHCEPPGEVNGGPERRKSIVEPLDPGLVRDIDLTDDVHLRIRHKRKTVEFGSYQIRDVTDRVRGAQCANNRAAQGARPAGYDDVAAGEINHGDSSSDQALVLVKRSSILAASSWYPSFDVYTGLFGDPPPARDFVMDQRGERRWRAAYGLAADVGKTLLDLGLVDDAIEFGVEPSDHP